MGGVGQVERGGRGGVGEGGTQGGHLPPSPSPLIHWGRNILDGQGRSPLAKGQLGFPLKRRKPWRLWEKRREGRGRGCSPLSLRRQGSSLNLGRAEYSKISHLLKEGH